MDAVGLHDGLVRLFILPDIQPDDLLLIGLLLIAIAAYFIGYAVSSTGGGCPHSSAGVTLGRGASFLKENLTGSEHLSPSDGRDGVMW